MHYHMLIIYLQVTIKDCSDIDIVYVGGATMASDESSVRVAVR